MRSNSTSEDKIELPRFWDISVGNSSDYFLKIQDVKSIPLMKKLIIAGETSLKIPGIITIVFKNNGQVSAVSEHLPLPMTGPLCGIFIKDESIFIVGGILNYLS